MKRLIFFILLIITIINPGIKVKKTVEKEKKAVLIDVSKSMEGKNFEMAKKVLEVFDKNFDFFVFSDKLRRVEKKNLKGIKPEGNLTGIIKALNNLEGYKEVYLISDGKNNIDEEEKTYNFRINSIYCGERDFLDGAIKDIDYPDYVFEDSPVVVDVGIEFKGKLPERAFLYVKEGNSLIKKVSFVPMPYKIVSVSFKPEKTGKREYKIVLGNFSEEKNKKNNLKKFSINVLPSKIRILYICGRPGWEYRFLRRFLKSNPRIELVSFIILRNPEDVALAPDKEVSLIPFPAREIFLKDVFDYDIFVLENFDYRRFFPANYLENVKKYVFNGGNFLMIGGENSFGKIYYNTAIKEILPVVISKEDKFLIKDFKLKAKGEHPVTGNRKEWKNLPIMTGINEVKGVKGKVLLETDEGEPYLVVGEFGRGRVGVILGNTLWRLSFMKDRKYFYWDFWKRFIYWFLRFPFVEELNVKINKRNFRVGEELVLKVKCKFKDKDDIEIIIFSPDKERIKGELSYDWEKEIAFFKYRFKKEGLYRIYVRKKDFEKKFKIFVKKVNVELLDKTGEPEFLKQLSLKTEGKFFNYDEIEKLKKNLGEEKYYKKIYPARTLYWLVFLIFFLVFSWISNSQ